MKAPAISKMLVPTTVLLCLTVGLCVACSKRNDPAYGQFLAHLSEMNRAYESTNATVAEKGLLDYRGWLTNQIEIDPGNNAGYDASLYMADARLFDLYGIKGDTNRAEAYYSEASEVYKRVLRNEHRTPYLISKEELRQLLVRQERTRKPGWKDSK